MDKKKLLARLAAIKTEAKSILDAADSDNAGNLSEDQQKAFDALMKESDQVEANIKRVEKIEELDASAGRITEPSAPAAPDAGNPRAWVTAAKPLVFAGPKRGGDLDEAVRLLDQALELEPGLESALLLRALVWERRGDQERATADWQAALDTNPQCRPASARVDGAP